jgi:hypothetical protein
LLARGELVGLRFSMGSGDPESTTLIGGDRDLPGTTSLLLCPLWFQTEVGMPAGSALRLIKPLASYVASR